MNLVFAPSAVHQHQLGRSGVRDDTHVEQQNGVNVQVGSYTEFLIHNVGNTPIAVTCGSGEPAGRSS